jgi:hypothetical protein
VIPGATDKTYTTTVADVGDSISGYVQAFNGIFPSYASQMYLAGDTFTIIEKTPVNTVAPQIVGAPYVGETLNSTAGAWNGHDPTYTREWLECGSDGLDCQPLAPDQTGSTYTITPADLGSTLELQVTATQADPSQNRVGQATSAPTAVITNPPAGGGDGGGGGNGGGGSGGGGGGGGGGSTQAIRIIGPKHLGVGSRLFGPALVAGYTTVSYQWLRNGKAIKHANHRAYKLQKADLGHRISVRVKLTRSSGGAVTLVSNTLRVPRSHGHQRHRKHRKHGHRRHHKHRHHKHRRHR